MKKTKLASLVTCAHCKQDFFVPTVELEKELTEKLEQKMCDEDYWRKDAERLRKEKFECPHLNRLVKDRDVFLQRWHTVKKERDEARELAQDTIDGLKAIIDIRVDERDEARRFFGVLYRYYKSTAYCPWCSKNCHIEYSTKNAKRELPWL